MCEAWCGFFMDFLSCSTITFLNNFLICRVALCCPHYLCQFCMVFLHYFCLHMFLHTLLLLTNFLFKCTELILTVSVSSSWEFCAISTSALCTMWYLLLLHTFLKWPIFLHPVHVFPYAGHCHGACIPLHYLHGHLLCVASVYPGCLSIYVPF